VSFKDNLETWIDEIKGEFSYSHKEKAFIHLYIRDFREDHSFDDAGIRRHVVDNTNDCGIDALYVNRENDLVLIQSKYSENSDLLSGELCKLDKFLSYYFEIEEKNRERFLSEEKINSALRTVLEMEVFVEDIRNIHFYYLCGSFSDSIKSQFKNIESKFKEHNFFVEFIDISKLEALFDPYKVSNEACLTINEKQFFETGDLKLSSETSKQMEIKSCVFSVKASSLKDLYDRLGDSLFEFNVRNFLSFRKPINKQIKMEVEKAGMSKLWFYNNGIVAVCDRYNIVGNKVQVKNIQIVNGGQTVRSISATNYVADSVEIVTKLVSIENSGEVSANDKREFINRIAINSNRQNPITNRDLKSNDPMQQRLQEMFRKYDILYKIKSGEEKIDDWKKDLKRKKKDVMNSDIVGYFISMFLQKTDASGGRIALAYLPYDEGDSEINYENVFGTISTIDRTFKKFFFAWEIGKIIEKYRSEKQSAFLFHYFSNNIMLSLLGFWFYLNQNEGKRNERYEEDKVKEFLLSDFFDVERFFKIEEENKITKILNNDKIHKYLDFLTTNIHIHLHSKEITNNPKKINSYFKKSEALSKIAELIQPLLGLENSYIGESL